jgi:hypothetical protein
VSAKSPSLSPRPVKSKRRVAMPAAARQLQMWSVARRFFEQVKQWANRAQARGDPTGSVSFALSLWPRPLSKCCGMSRILGHQSLR